MKHIGDEFVASYDISKSNAKVCEDSEDYKSCVDWYKMLMDEGNDVVLKHIKDNSLEALKPEEAFAGYMIGFGAKNEISLLAKKPYNEESMKVFDKWYKIRTNINKEFDRMMSSDAFKAGMNSYYKTDNPTYVTLNGMVKKFNEVLVQQAANKEVEHGNQKNFNASADKNKEVAIKP